MNLLRSIITKLSTEMKDEWIRRRYISAGREFAEQLNLIYGWRSVSISINFTAAMKELRKWEQKIVQLGYRPIDINSFLQNFAKRKKLPLLEKATKNENLVCYAAEYHKKYKNSIEPFLDSYYARKTQDLNSFREMLLN